KISYVVQADDGIRRFHVTGVQTCALPIFVVAAPLLAEAMPAAAETGVPVITVLLPADTPPPAGALPRLEVEAAAATPIARHTLRSEERRVGEARPAQRPRNRENDEQPPQH